MSSEKWTVFHKPVYLPPLGGPAKTSSSFYKTNNFAKKYFYSQL